MMERAISTINQFDLTKTQIEIFVAKVLNEIEPRQALPLLARLTAMEKIVEGVKNGIKDMILDEAHLEGAKSFTLKGVTYSKKVRTSYDYSHCAKHEQLKSELKALEDMMKAGHAFVDPDTGEVIEPATKSESEYIAVTLPVGEATVLNIDESQPDGLPF